MERRISQDVEEKYRESMKTVSYTHLDVYKRQLHNWERIYKYKYLQIQSSQQLFTGTVERMHLNHEQNL